MNLNATQVQSYRAQGYLYIGKRAEHFEPPQGFHVGHV